MWHACMCSGPVFPRARHRSWSEATRRSTQPTHARPPPPALIRSLLVAPERDVGMMTDAALDALSLVGVAGVWHVVRLVSWRGGSRGSADDVCGFGRLAPLLLLPVSPSPPAAPHSLFSPHSFAPSPPVERLEHSGPWGPAGSHGAFKDAYMVFEYVPFTLASLMHSAKFKLTPDHIRVRGSGGGWWRWCWWWWWWRRCYYTAAPSSHFVPVPCPCRANGCREPCGS